MRKAFLPSLIVGLLALGALCGPAAAAPSSNSAVNEYTERLPEPGGGQSNGGRPGGGEKGSGANPGGSGGGAGSSPLPPGTAQQLGARGDSGKNLSGIVEETGSAASGAETGASSGGSAGNDDSESLLDSIGGALSNLAGGSDTGLGAGFPILLAVVLLGAVGALVTRHRRREGPHADA